MTFTGQFLAAFVLGFLLAVWIAAFAFCVQWTSRERSAAMLVLFGACHIPIGVVVAILLGAATS